MSVFELKDVCFSYDGKFQSIKVLKNASCSFEYGKAYAIAGKSGSGKSTALMLMAGMDLPKSGEVLFCGEPTSKMKLETYRREKVSVIYQSFRLLPLLTAVENVMYPMELRKVAPKEAMERAKELILKVGLPENVFNRFPGMLSGGEQQRIAIARALAMDTKVMLADEPTGNLDSENSANIIDLLLKLAHEAGYCVIIVTHDLDVLGKMDFVYKMRDGAFIAQN